MSDKTENQYQVQDDDARKEKNQKELQEQAKLSRELTNKLNKEHLQNQHEHFDTENRKNRSTQQKQSGDESKQFYY